MLPYIMPGAVIGISMIITFSKKPFSLTGTLAIMMIALAIRRMPFTSRSATAAMIRGCDMEAEVYNQSTFIILKAAYLYYIKDLSQNEIADMLNISVTTVSRLIKKAKDEKIVEFVIRDPYIECIHLEEELKKTFGLKDVIIAPNPRVGSIENNMPCSDNIKKLVALEGARYIQRIIREKDVLGITWGSTMIQMRSGRQPSKSLKKQCKMGTLLTMRLKRSVLQTNAKLQLYGTSVQESQFTTPLYGETEGRLNSATA